MSPGQRFLAFIITCSNDTGGMFHTPTTYDPYIVFLTVNNSVDDNHLNYNEIAKY